MERSIRVLHSNPVDIIEIRILGPGKLITAGFFDNAHFREAAERAAKYKARGVYIVLNRIHPGLLALATNGFVERIEKTTSDDDVLRRLWLPLDFDPVRPAGISSSDKEKAAAKQVAMDCVKWLTEQGWPEPITGDSGNGHHALFAIDLPNDNDSKALLKKVLERLAARFNNSAVKLDTANFNAARIFKLYGSIAAKGGPLPDRPHRTSRLIHMPDPITPVSLAQLEAIAGAPEGNRSNGAGRSRQKHLSRNQNSSSDIEEALTFIDPDPRENWLHVAMALKSELGEAGKPIWDRWSERSGKFNKPDQDATWSGLEVEGGITIGTLFKMALDGGWTGSKSRRNGGPHHQQKDRDDGSFGNFGDEFSPQWKTPEEISAELLPVPALTPALIPAGLRPWIVDVAERQQCPLDFPTAAALVAASSLVGRTLAIRPKREDDWEVIPNLWGAVVARSGTLKTPALNEGMAPINQLRSKAEKRFKDDLANRKFISTVNEARKDDLAKKIRAALKEGKDPEILKAAYDDILEDKPIEKRYVTNDTTVEKLGELLNENPRGLLVYRDELTGFLSSLERQGRENDRAFYLEAWNGNGKFDYDRITRGTVHIEATTVSLLGGIQPAPLEAYLRETFADGRDDGLIQRFQLVVYPDMPAHWVNVDRQPDTQARKTAIAIFATLDALIPLTVGAVIEEEHLPYVRFTAEGQELFDAWRARLEEKLRSTDEHPVMVAHLAKYRSLMPSLALLFELIGGFDSFDGGGSGLISEKWLDATDGRIVSKDSALMAVAWCEFLEQHARRIYQGVVHKLQNLVASLAGKIRAGKLPNPFTARAVYLHEWSGLTGPEMVVRVLEVLEDANWVRAVEAKSPAGGRPTVVYHINPAVMSSEMAS